MTSNSLEIPALTAKKPGPGVRTLGLVMPGVRQVSAQIEPYTQWWSENNQTIATATGPVLAVIGDSTAIGIGASAPEHSYIGILGRALTERDGTPWAILNMAQSGARVADGIERQLPVVERVLGSVRGPTTVVCVIGTNDIVWGRETVSLRESLRTLIGALDPPSCVGLLGGKSARVHMANKVLRSTVKEKNLTLIDTWSEPGPTVGERLSADRFHPNDLGYAIMARPFLRALDCPVPPLPEVPSD